jgi:hypothetical protein
MKPRVHNKRQRFPMLTLGAINLYFDARFAEFPLSIIDIL